MRMYAYERVMQVKSIEFGNSLKRMLSEPD